MNDIRNAPCCEEIAAACCYLNPFVMVATSLQGCLAKRSFFFLIKRKKFRILVNCVDFMGGFLKVVCMCSRAFPTSVLLTYTDYTVYILTVKEKQVFADISGNIMIFNPPQFHR